MRTLLLTVVVLAIAASEQPAPGLLDIRPGLVVESAKSGCFARLFAAGFVATEHSCIFPDAVAQAQRDAIAAGDRKAALPHEARFALGNVKSGLTCFVEFAPTTGTIATVALRGPLLDLRADDKLQREFVSDLLRGFAPLKWNADCFLNGKRARLPAVLDHLSTKDAFTEIIALGQPGHGDSGKGHWRVEVSHRRRGEVEVMYLNAEFVDYDLRTRMLAEEKACRQTIADGIAGNTGASEGKR